MSIGSRIREARRLRGVTQAALAKAVCAGTMTISNYETGISEPDAARLAQIMNFLGVDANYIYQDYFEKKETVPISRNGFQGELLSSSILKIVRLLNELPPEVQEQSIAYFESLVRLQNSVLSPSSPAEVSSEQGSP
jgi:transcriptional regulator with XRE-family HTH domain